MFVLRFLFSYFLFLVLAFMISRCEKIISGRSLKYLAGFGGSLREKMVRDAESLKREALKPGGARAEVCVRLLNAESSSSQSEALDHWRCR